MVGWRHRGGQCEGQVTGQEKWEVAPLSTLVTLTHTYTAARLYMATARLFSVMGHLVQSLNITVFDALPCSELSMAIQKSGTLQAPINITRAEELRVRSTAQVICSVAEINMDICKCM